MIISSVLVGLVIVPTSEETLKMMLTFPSKALSSSTSMSKSCVIVSVTPTKRELAFIRIISARESQKQGGRGRQKKRKRDKEKKRQKERKQRGQDREKKRERETNKQR